VRSFLFSISRCCAATFLGLGAFSSCSTFGRVGSYLFSKPALPKGGEEGGLPGGIGTRVQVHPATPDLPLCGLFHLGGDYVIVNRHPRRTVLKYIDGVKLR